MAIVRSCACENMRLHMLDNVAAVLRARLLEATGKRGVVSAISHTRDAHGVKAQLFGAKVRAKVALHVWYCNNKMLVRCQF